MSDCKAQLHILRQRVVKQRTAVSNAQEALDRSKEKLRSNCVTESCLLILSRRLLLKVAFEVGDGPHLTEVQSCTDGMDLTGQDGDLDHPEPPAGSPSPGPDRALLQMGSYLNRMVHSLLLGCVMCMGWMFQRTACVWSLKAPCFLNIGNRMRVFDPCESGWVLVQRRRQRCSQGQGQKGKESEVKKAVLSLQTVRSQQERKLLLILRVPLEIVVTKYRMRLSS